MTFLIEKLNKEAFIANADRCLLFFFFIQISPKLMAREWWDRKSSPIHIIPKWLKRQRFCGSAHRYMAPMDLNAMCSDFQDCALTCSLGSPALNSCYIACQWDKDGHQYNIFISATHPSRPDKNVQPFSRRELEPEACAGSFWAKTDFR